jgi:phosphatidylethanolamine/phosphatidyl-N-methylethanolamine N-methyltransferase
MASDSLIFLRRFLSRPASVGSIVPSSPALARAIVSGLSIGTADTIVELGPGTGAFTSELIRLLPDPSCYVGIERDPAFVALLRRRHPGLSVVQGPAEDAVRLVEGLGRSRVVAVVSGIPFAVLGPDSQDAIVRQLDHLLQAGAEFRTFQYVHAYMLPTAVRFRRRMAPSFHEHPRSAMVLRNLPPAYVLRWRRL